jgi:hypothetical protein
MLSPGKGGRGCFPLSSALLNIKFVDIFFLRALSHESTTVTCTLLALSFLLPQNVRMSPNFSLGIPYVHYLFICLLCHKKLTKNREWHTAEKEYCAVAN